MLLEGKTLIKLTIITVPENLFFKKDTFTVLFIMNNPRTVKIVIAVT